MTTRYLSSGNASLDTVEAVERISGVRETPECEKNAGVFEDMPFVVADPANSSNSHDNGGGDKDAEAGNLVFPLSKLLFGPSGKKELESYDYYIKSALSTSVVSTFVQLEKWFIVVLISVFVALARTAIVVSSDNLMKWRLGLVVSFYDDPWSAYFISLAIAGPSAIIAAMTVVSVPLSGGSGIPDVKAYLNGNLIPGLLAFRVWVGRIVGLIFVTSCGLFAASEGPMAHLGAITGAGISQGRFKVPNFRGGWKKLQVDFFRRLRNHQAKFNFVTIGAATGVAAAFGAPLGGLLFSLEEAATHWGPELTWMALFGALLASVLTRWGISGFQCEPTTRSCVSTEGYISFPYLPAKYAPWELLVFAGMGVLCGLLGALFCQVVKLTHVYRPRLYKWVKWQKLFRVLEVLLILTVTVSLQFWTTHAMGCTLWEQKETQDSSTAEDGDVSVFTTGCQQGDFNDMGTIFLQSPYEAIRALFASNGEVYSFRAFPLFLGFSICFCLTLATYGSAIASGLFIPNILSGACLGRLLGQCIRLVNPQVEPGVYALVGATGILAGFSRMTVSLAVIVVELTSDLYLFTPIVIVIFTAKWTADMFNPSAYDIVIALKNYPMLEILNTAQRVALETRTVLSVMTPEYQLSTLDSSPTLGDLYGALKTSHNGFPLLEGEKLVGLVTRADIFKLLASGEIEGVSVCSQASEDSSKECFDMEKLLEYPRRYSMILKGSCVPKRVDLKPFCSPHHQSVVENTPFELAYKMFMSLGLRHLLVLSEDRSRLAGLLTRKDFVEAAEESTHLGCVVSNLRSISNAPPHPDDEEDPDESYSPTIPQRMKSRSRRGLSTTSFV